MTVAKVEVERFSLTCSKPFDAVMAALKSAACLLNLGVTGIKVKAGCVQAAP